MFTAKLAEPRLLTSITSILSDFVTEASFSFQKEGIKLLALDPANIAMVILNILPSAFVEYKVEQPVDLTINIEALKQVIKRAKPTDSVSLTLDKNRLKVTIIGKSIKNFFIPLLEREGKERKIPNLEFMATIELDATEFRDYIDDAAIAADAIIFESNKNAFTLSAGDMGSKVQIELTKGSDPLFQLASTDSVRAMYSIEYLKKMARAATIAETVTIQFANDYPLKLDFKSLNRAQISFILAPRIENK
ncbi:MAG: proliferating cell nuclear antigen (pcna) [Candidatus Nanoarchaeia archaeon]